MKAKEIQELIDFIAKSGLNEVNVETESFKISVKRNASLPVSEPVVVQNSVVTPLLNPAQVNTQSTSANNEAKESSPDTNKSKKEENYITIKSTMIGTFYRSPNPDAPNFVNVGDEIKVGAVICIIEAMKLFNEIESEVSGRIVKVLVENASPVEYDQPLFMIEPN